MIFPNSEPKGRGLDIQQSPESVPLFGAEEGLMDHPFVGLNEPIFSNGFLKGN